MRNLLFLLTPGLLVGCNPDLGLDAVSIRPIYDWVDGCASVEIGGHGFGEDSTVTIGGNPLENMAMPSAESDDRLERLNAGFEITGTVPAGAAGFADVVVESGGVQDTISGDFYYVSCFADPYPEFTVGGEAASAGSEIEIHGCNLKDTYVVELYDPASYDPLSGDFVCPGGVGEDEDCQASITSQCRTAQVSFAAPALPDGTYQMRFKDADGNVVFDSCYEVVDTGATTGTTTGTTAPVFDCDSHFAVTYGGSK